VDNSRIQDIGEPSLPPGAVAPPSGARSEWRAPQEESKNHCRYSGLVQRRIHRTILDPLLRVGVDCTRQLLSTIRLVQDVVRQGLEIRQVRTIIHIVNIFT
jgi:hypothetical protein